MEKYWSFLKTTLLGGVVFLFPLVLFVVVVGKAIQIMMMVAEPLGKMIPLESVGGIAMVNIIAIVVLLVLCFLAGVAARSVLGKRCFEMVDDKLHAFPGYALFKARLTGNIGYDLKKQTLKPHLVQLGPKSQVAYIVDVLPDDRVALFLPGAPDPWSGSVIFVNKDLVEPLNSDLHKTTHIYESLGRGASKLFE